MNAIVPLNIAAIRVNQNDTQKVTGNFQGKTAVFEKMPWSDPSGSFANSASTGDKIFNPLGVTGGDGPVNSPSNPLCTGVHLHWELPDFFRKGSQTAEGSKINFPHAPNRWLITRYLSIYRSAQSAYDPVTNKSWIVESDYVSQEIPVDLRPVISVPLPATPAYKEQPYSFMGRVVNLSDWNPSGEAASDYLPSYNGTDGDPLFLTSIGFVGSYFGSYYPESCSVFGFWDNFSDVPEVQNAIQNNTAIQFRATYQVTGWLNEAGSDPLAGMAAQVTGDYNDYIKKCLANQVSPKLTPTDFFENITKKNMKWSFNLKDISYTLDNNYNIQSLSVPSLTICSGSVQEIVWNMATNMGTTYFLSSGGNNQSVWPAVIDLAIGNSTEEALSALLKYDMGQQSDDPDILKNYELLLDSLQLGLLANLEDTPNKLITLEEGMHNNGFANQSGGYTWSIVNSAGNSGDPATAKETSLPLDLAEQLYLLNTAQKAYDMGRGGLTIRRKQVFMDWIRYVKIYTGETSDPNVTENAIAQFMLNSSGGEINDVINYGNTVGILSFLTDADSGNVLGINKPGPSVLPASLAYAAWNNFQTVNNAVVEFNSLSGGQWALRCGKAPDFYLPAEPVVLMQGPMMEPPQRNGADSTTFIRLSQEILSALSISYDSTLFSVNVSDLLHIPPVDTQMPPALQADIQALTGEVFLLTPMLAPVVTAALGAKGGSNNPAVLSPGNFTISLMYIQGGLSPLDLSPNAGGVPAPSSAGLYETINADNYIPLANTSIAVTTPQAVSVIFTNAANDGWVADPVNWNTQQALPAFSATRVDPFMPIFMIWNVQVNPLLWQQDPVNQLYGPGNLTSFFSLNIDGVDYQYNMNNGTPVNFTAAASVNYQDDATMRSGASKVLSYQITNYINSHSKDPENPVLQQIADMYKGKKILSQALSGLNSGQVLTSYVAQVAVENLVKGPRDTITAKLASAAGATTNDNWYDDSFNSIEPISGGIEAMNNFGPLRAGFMEILGIEVVDVFGQRMDLSTSSFTPAGALDCITSYAMSPQEGDTVNTGRIYLAPRILTPTRLWYEWLSATHNNDIPGVTDDFVVMNSHPATSPICGWVMPNHLDDDLFFYDSQGNAIGTFGVEHLGTNPSLVYRTRAGNLANPTDDLALDIGQPGSPTVNPHLANFMWYLKDQTPLFLAQMMQSIQDSETFINPASYAQDSSLSVLIGRPLALTRSVLAMETIGNLLPLSQADTSASSPFPQDVNNGRTNYTDRMNHSAANLENVQFPVRLGDLANLDDGLVGYLVETTQADPYTAQVFYAPAANSTWTGGVQQPGMDSLELTLNQKPLLITMLIDPRAAVHATTGVLAVNELNIPASLYSAALKNLAVNFTTRPVLQMKKGLVVPLPKESGFAWSWITPDAPATTPLKPDMGNEDPTYGYTPQSLQEGWLQLTPNSK